MPISDRSQHTLSGAYWTLTGRPRISRVSKCLRAVSASSRVTYSKILLSLSAIHVHGLLEQSFSPSTWIVPIDISEVDLHAAGHVPAPILEILQNLHPQLNTFQVSGDVHMRKSDAISPMPKGKIRFYPSVAR